MFAYAFDSYWKDVGTIESLWEANMDLLKDKPELDLHDPDWRVFAVNPAMPPHFISKDAKVSSSLISEGAIVFGEVKNSVIFSGVKIAKGAKVVNSVVMPFTTIGKNAYVEKAVIGQHCEICAGAKVGAEDGSIVVVPEGDVVVAETATGKQVG